ncbi:hypothetical protein HMPREF0373_00640 [Eubacterium ramulus ATCC 29099]|uniref:Uncharacterized protein n=1 Tax=Eubacterium ramulus ATCC 29099 TaxID=1256908 RepID=U2PJ67_EUBRA|nr:hypothetical protein HMPREF0373_00640 [Eubacterium ramulus ATCC 29099]
MVLLHTALGINHFSNLGKMVIYRAMTIFINSLPVPVGSRSRFLN